MLIAVANKRTEKAWKNKEISWAEFLALAKNTRRTFETVGEYKKLPKSQQDDIKDVGGFVAGKLKGGKRKSGFVEFRSMLTLDMDYATPDVWDQITTLFNFTCCIYSTHKHIPEKPRLRLIIPLSRNVTADEYIAVARMVASDIGIEMFDDTTYEPTRLMYWASTSADGEFVFEHHNGDLLDPDTVLCRYKNWRDVAEYPVSSRQTTIVNHQLKKQVDPLIKDGIIGAFCRAYTVTEAIDTFLPDIYKPSMVDNRYDFIPADSAAGVVIYDDKFCYSHHATDPACGRLCNAFDVVMLHKFGHLDEDIKLDTTEGRRPSFKSMQNFCVNDDGVKKQLAEDRMEQAQEEFSDTDADWQSRLTLNKNGQIKDDLYNIVLIVQNDEKLSAIAYNQHRDGIDVRGKTPWKQIKSGWNDADAAALKVYFDKTYRIWSPTKIKEALTAVTAERMYHPIKEYFNALPEWDGVRRVDTLLIDYLGAEDNGYSRAIIRKALVAAVARLFEPGKKFDSVLILNGPQGMGKSTFFSRLGQKWFSDSLTISDMRDKAGPEKLQGYWILELGELAGMKKTDVETVKSFITRTDDKYRASYGFNVESHPRQCIIVGSTNSESGFLRDITGNRRFWPVRVSGESTKKPWELTDIDQIWAEALQIYKNGEDLFLKGDEAQMAISAQVDAMETDDREGLVRGYLDRLLPENWDAMDLFARRNFLLGSDFGNSVDGTVKRKLVCSMEIWCECFGKEPASLKKIDSYELSSIMARIEGWHPYEGTKNGSLRFPIYNKQRAFVRNEHI